MTKVVTFYSYKGGVGRTMALVNTAHVLARDGWRVLMVDFDLEAPGMTHFFADRVREQARPDSKDAIDLLLEIKRTIPEVEPKKPAFKRVSLESYVIHIPLPEAWMETEETGSPYRNGRLDLLPATLDPAGVLAPEPSRGYLERLDALDLPGIFSAGGPRHRFGDWLRRHLAHARFTAPGDLLFTMREQVQAAYDIVLVDSRTGLNEISGLCIGPLSDALVVCVGLNQQNIEGTRYFMHKAGLLHEERSKPYAIVVGPVPIWHTRVASERIEEIRSKLKASAIVSVPYHPSAALTETVFVIDEPDESITKSYLELAPKIAALVEERDLDRRVLDQVRHALATGSWAGYARQLVPWMSSMRLRSRYLPEQWLEALQVLEQIPSAVTVASLPTLAFVRDLGHGNLCDIVSGAAVSAFRLKSHVPFERVWKAVARVEEDDDELCMAAAGYLVFMQLRVLKTMPQNAELLEYMSAALTHWRETPHLPPWHGVWTSIVAFVYAAELGLDVPASEHRDALKKIVPEEVGWDAKFLSPAPGMRDLEGLVFGVMRALMNVPGFVWLRPDFESKIRADLMKVLESARGYLQELNEIHRIGPAGGFFAWHRARVHIREGFAGYWPESVMVSVVSLLKGAEAIDEILAWIKLCRLTYGYAWRVIVDWRHLAAVQDHPKLVAFLAEEDERVEKIEAAIDRGRYPL